MKKPLLTLLIIFFIISGIYAIDEYAITLIKTIPIGNGLNELGYGKGMVPGRGIPKPTTFTIDSNKKFYICDWVNHRIMIYNLNLDYLSSIQEDTSKEYFFSSVYYLKIDDMENIIAVYSTTGLTKINKTGEILFHLDPNNLPSGISSNNFFPYKDYILYSDHDKIGCLGPKGNKLEEMEINIILSEIKKSKSVVRNFDNLSFSFDDYLTENKLVLNGNRLLTTRKGKYVQYIKNIKRNQKKIELQDKVELNLIKVLYTFIGFDQDDNVYWVGKINKKYAIVVLSMFGEILDCFYIEKDLQPPYAVAPNGDIYLWDRQPDGICFYKITRRW